MRQRIDNIVFELTQACNQRCRFCYNYWRDGSPLPSPDKSLCRRTLRRLLSQAEVRTISFSGGEPMCVPDVADLALYCRFRGVSVNILSNGTLMTQTDILNFREIGVGAVQVPVLSADAAVHEYLTGLPGSWKKATGTLARVSELMPGKAYAVLVITRINAPDVTGTLELIGSLGVKSVMVNRFNIGGLGLRNRDELVLDKAGLQKAFSDVDAFAARHPEMFFMSGVCIPMCVLDSRQFPHIRFSYCSTDFNLRPVTVDYSGNVRFCNHSPKVLGNIYRSRIGEILSSPEAVSYYSSIPQFCMGCPDLKPCNGGCRAASEQVYGNFSEPDPLLEVLEKGAAGPVPWDY